MITTRELARDCAAGRLHSVYLLVGGEEYFLQEALSLVRGAALGPAEDVHGWQRMEGGQLSLDSFLAAAQTLSLFSPRRVVVVDGWEEFIQRLTPAARAALADYLARPDPSVNHMFIARGLDPGRVPNEWRAVVVSCRPLFPNRVPGWLREYARSRGSRISPDVAALLADLVGTDLFALSREVDKLLLYAPEAEGVERETVEALVPASRQASIFEWTDAVGARDTVRALRTYRNLAEAGMHPAQFLIMIQRHFKQLLVARRLLSEGRDHGAIAKAIRTSPYFLDGYLAQARRFSPAALYDSWHKFLETDRGVKTSRSTPDLLMEALILDLCGASLSAAGS